MLVTLAVVLLVLWALGFLAFHVGGGLTKLVGEGRWPASRVADILDARDRRAAGPTAPPDGLTLTGVVYDVPASRR